MGHLWRKISHHCCFFLKKGVNVTWHLICTNYKASPVPAGGLEAQLLLTFSVKTFFANDLYQYDHTEEQTKNNEEESSDDEEIDFQITVEENVTNENNKNVIEID